MVEPVPSEVAMYMALPMALWPCTKALHAQWVLGGCTVACCSANKGHGERVAEAWEVSDSAIKHWTEQLTTLVTLVAHALGIALNINGPMMLLNPGSALGSDEKIMWAKVEALDIGETALTLLQHTFLVISLGLKAIGIKFNVASMDLDFSLWPGQVQALASAVPHTPIPWMTFPLGPGLLCTSGGPPGQSTLMRRHLPVPSVCEALWPLC